jgi:hypothetical protein
MSTKLLVTTENEKRADCIVIHAIGGVGKTSLLAEAVKTEGGIFLRVGEDGLSPLGLSDVPRYPDVINSWTQLQDVLRDLIVEKHDFKLVAIDSLDMIVPALDEYVVEKFYSGDADKANAYKAKYAQYYSEFQKILKAFEILRSRGITVLVSCHSVIVNHRDPSTEAFKRWEMNLPGGEKTSLANLLFDFSDYCLFGSFDVTVKDNRGVGGDRRVLSTRWTPAFDAKRRYNIPDKILFDWTTFKSVTVKKS